MGRLLLSTAAAVLLLAGCSSDDPQGGPDDAAGDGAGATEGEQATDADPDEADVQLLSVAGFDVAVPADWDVVDETEDLVRATSSGTPSRAVVTIQRADGQVQDVREVAAALKTQDRLTLDDFEESDWEEVEVTGADEALRDEATWTGVDDGDPAPRRNLNVYTRTGESAVVLMIQSDADDFEASWVEPIVESFGADG